MNHSTEKELLTLVKQDFLGPAATDNQSRCQQLWSALIKLIEPIANHDQTLEISCANILQINQIQQINFDQIFCLDLLHRLPGERLRLDVLKQLKNKISATGEIVITVDNFWQQKKYFNLMVKFFLLKILGKNRMDLGDLISYQTVANQITNRRYYHAFTAWQLKGLARAVNLKIKKFQQDRDSYYLILQK